MATSEHMNDQLKTYLKRWEARNSKWDTSSCVVSWKGSVDLKHGSNNDNIGYIIALVSIETKPIKSLNFQFQI